MTPQDPDQPEVIPLRVVMETGVQVVPDQKRGVTAGKVVEKGAVEFGQALAAISKVLARAKSDMAQAVSGADELTLSFHLTLSAKGKFIVAEAGATGDFGIEVKWDLGRKPLSPPASA